MVKIGEQKNSVTTRMDKLRSAPSPKLEPILLSAAKLMAQRGYGQTTNRDVARQTGFSLSGLKVCTRALHSLNSNRFRKIALLRRRYVGLVASVVAEIIGVSKTKAERDQSARHYTLFVFGILN